MYVFKCGTESDEVHRKQRKGRKLCPECQDAEIDFKIQWCSNCNTKMFLTPRNNNTKICNDCRKAGNFAPKKVKYFETREDFSEFDEPTPLEYEKDSLDVANSFSVLLVNSGYLSREIVLGEQSEV